jgi:exodeoxyribonuclease-3
MKIASWNVNSLRARLDRVLGWLAAEAPDVLLLQETKVVDADFPREPLATAGYHACFHGQKTYNGVAVLARTAPVEVARGLSDGGDEAGARLLVADVGEVRVASVYVPNGRAVDTPHFAEKLAWLGRLEQRLAALAAPGRPLVVGGDWNVTPDDRDVWDPEGLRDTIHCHPAERSALADLLASGLVDTFRLHHQDAGHYSWWDYRQLGFPKNRGLRIDLLLASRELAPRCTAAGIDREARKGQGASDHTPIWMTID